MKNVKNFESFLNEGMFKNIGRFFKKEHYSEESPIKYQGYDIPVYVNDSTGERLLGHPRPHGDSAPYGPNLLAYNVEKLPALKKSIETLIKIEKEGESSIKSGDYQGADSFGMDAGAGTAVPSIFPPEDLLIPNPRFKGYAVSEGKGISPAIYKSLEEYFKSTKKHTLAGAQEFISKTKKGWDLSQEDFEEAKKEFK